MTWAKEKGLKVIEKCAHTAGGVNKSKKLGTWGEIGCYSFEEKKCMTTGDGGMLCPNCSQSQPLTYPLSVNALKVLRLLQNYDYSTVSKLKKNPELSRELEGVMRTYLRYLLERELKSVAWLDTLRK